MLAGAHLVLGASSTVVAVGGTICVMAISILGRYGALNLATVLFVLLAVRYVGFPFVWKLVLGQRLDSYLEQPAAAFLVVLVGMLGYLAAMRGAAGIRVGPPLLKPVWDTRRLGAISLAAALIGTAANLALAQRISKDYTGITVAEFFISFLHLALIAGVARVIVRTNGKRGFDPWVITLVTAEIVFALARNSRIALLEVVVAYLVTMVAFRAKIGLRQTVGFSVAVIAMVMLITPVMLQVRSIRSDLSWTERIDATINAASRWREAIAAYKAWQELSAQDSPFQYYGAPRNVLERMSLVNHVDVLKSGTDRTREVGFEDLSLAVQRSLPRMLAPNKPRGYSEGDWLYCQVGIDCRESGYATAPLIANGYVAFGWVGAFLYPFFLGLPILLIVKKAVGWSIAGNVWAIYMLLLLHDGFVEGSSDAYVTMIVRELPQDLIVLFFICLVVENGISVIRSRQRVRADSYPSEA